MDLALVMNELLPGVEYNPAFVEFTEEEAREKSLWTSTETMPTSTELGACWDGLKVGIEQGRLLEEYKKAQANYVQATLDTMDYDSIHNLAMYAVDPNNYFYTEATALIAWNTACVLKGYAVMNEVLAGTRTMPTIDEYLSELPTYNNI